MKIYAGYVINTKNGGEGFYCTSGLSAHVKVGEIKVRELVEEIDGGLISEGFRAVIQIPTNHFGGTIGEEGNDSILCKSLAEATNILKARPSRNEAVQRASKDGWRLTPTEAAKDAMAELFERAEKRRERMAYTRQSATAKLIEAGIFEANWEISKRCWKKSRTKIRVQDALAGDRCAAGCLCRDASKN